HPLDHAAKDHHRIQKSVHFIFFRHFFFRLIPNDEHLGRHGRRRTLTRSHDVAQTSTVHSFHPSHRGNRRRTIVGFTLNHVGGGAIIRSLLRPPAPYKGRRIRPSFGWQISRH